MTCSGLAWSSREGMVSRMDKPHWSPEIMTLAAHVRLLVLDVDGVMTDGRLHYDADGREAKVFHVRDGLGIKQLLAADVGVAVISGRSSTAVATRLAELGIGEVTLGRDDKLAALRELAGRLGMESLNRVAYVGDDLPDLPAIQAVGLGIAVADAHPQLRDQARARTQLGGGQGAVREVCDLLLAARRVNS